MQIFNLFIKFKSILAKRDEKQNSIGLVKTKENGNSANLPAIFGKQFGENKFSTLLSAFLYCYIHLLNLITEPNLI